MPNAASKIKYFAMLSEKFNLPIFSGPKTLAKYGKVISGNNTCDMASNTL
jgi:hypothetical protein